MRVLLALPLLLAACSGATDEAPVSTAQDSAVAKDSIVADTTMSEKDTAVADVTNDTSTTTPETSTEDASGSMCGGIAGKLCPSGYYCFTGSGKCAIPDGAGTCAAIPTGCTKELNPVCGCDGKTYDNPCFAAAAGVNIASAGACGGPSGCGACTKTEYCDFTVDLACSGEGTCKTRPGACPGIYDPVCGCDGKTYSNGCAAHAAGVEYASKDACP